MTLSSLPAALASVSLLKFEPFLAEKKPAARIPQAQKALLEVLVDKDEKPLLVVRNHRAQPVVRGQAPVLDLLCKIFFRKSTSKQARFKETPSTCLFQDGGEHDHVAD